MIYLGPYGSPESQERYNEVVAQWLANGRCWPVQEPPKAVDDPYTVTELICDYWQHARQYYVKDGQPTSEQHGMSLRWGLPQAFGRLEAKNFTALRLQFSLQARVDLRTAAWRSVSNVLANLAQFETELRCERSSPARQPHGGKASIGRIKARCLEEVNMEQVKTIVHMANAGDRITNMARATGLSRQTVYRVLKRTKVEPV